MLLINDQKLSALPLNNRFAVIYNEARMKLKSRFGDTIVLDFPPERYNKVPNPNGQGAFLEAPAGVLQKAYRRYVTKKEDFEVRYYSSQRTNSKGVVKHEPVYLNFNGRMILSISRQFDLIFYLLFVSPVAAKLDYDLEEYQNLERNARVQYQIFDETADATREMAAERLTAEVRGLVLSESIGLSEEKVKEFAVGYGLIPATKETHIDVARKLLLNYLLAKRPDGFYNYNLINEFKATVKMEEIPPMRKLVKEGIELGVLGLLPSEHGKRREWCILTPEGEKREGLCITNYIQDYDTTLVELLLADENILAEVKELIRLKKVTTSTSKELRDQDDMLKDLEADRDPSYETTVKKRQKRGTKKE